MSDPLIKVAVNIFVHKDGKLLLGKRKKVGNETWGLPAGHLEYGETPLEGIKRELEEETGIKSDNIEYKNTINFLSALDQTHYISVNFDLKNFSGEPVLTEPDKFYEWRWFDLNELPGNIFDGHTKIIANIDSKEFLIN